ncbi:hypothetical protein GCM10007103_27610 [Salinimicrobium marinum]|uniref:DUF4301 domain-containing protein n=1 Tax=Salinimicrobium marinum TaxID=680283 RepID=A0A918SK68_9FLAO|nr:DUF4301 family protein [Salinimicrobium marinum]GHA44914.1 hypothetical protein GCM10007103_27610 [Salinimicrobium marinum]
MDFSKEDVSQIKEKGLTTDEVKRQIAIFERGNVVMNVREAATIRNGIISCSQEEMDKLSGLYDSEKENLEVLKFVPASGAATRMFKAFYQFLDEYDPGKESVEEYTEKKNDEKLEMFFNRMKQLPFYDKVKQKITEEKNEFDTLPEDEQRLLFVKTMLTEEGLNLGDYPKGLVPFHKYEDHLATAFEEHLIEAADYAASNGKAKLHFTVSEEHQEKFKAEFTEIQDRLEKETGVNFQVSYSFQDPKTDTVAVTLENEPFRDENGQIFFRPGGHGALLENLDKQDADLIFIKNIDNVVIPKYRKKLADYKKMLAGKLLELQKETFGSIEKLEKDISEEKLEEIINFTRKKLNSGLSIDFDALEKTEKINVLKKKLNRPIRICGMVKNEGEPGGGPFWVTHKSGEISLQIVESAQIDHDNYQQSKIAQEATHFNPVDVVCGKKNYKGENFKLQDYVDEETSFIAKKTKDGKELKALELPGLWNGGMADWITIFVEVPVETFNPVKTVADLLKPTHQVS